MTQIIAEACVISSDFKSGFIHPIRPEFNLEFQIGLFIYTVLRVKYMFGIRVENGKESKKVIYFTTSTKKGLIYRKSGKMVINKGSPNRNKMVNTMMYHGPTGKRGHRCFRFW
jgi:hypothetical protein